MTQEVTAVLKNPSSAERARAAKRLDPVSEPRAVRWLLTGIALAFLAFFLVVPLAAVFVEALRKGVGFYLESLADPDAWAAIKLTLTVAAIAVPLNLVFGVCASWRSRNSSFAARRC